jgi:uncharacterized protein YndB with AHSA1/START domain
MDIVHQLIARVPPEKVYQALTEPAQLASWFADKVTGNTAQVGAEAAFHYNRGVIRIQITELEPDRKVVWKILQGLPGWEGVTGEMTWLLTTPYPGTMITLTHTGWLSMDGPYPSTNHKIGSLIDQMRAFVEASEVEPA